MSDVTVLVTGASSGFGEAITRRFVTERAHVFAAARRVDRLNAEIAAVVEYTDRPGKRLN